MADDRTIEADTTPLFQQPAKPARDEGVSGHQAYIPSDFEASSSGPRLTGNISSGSSAPKPTGGIFSFDFYASYFDVDTADVVARCLLALNPFSTVPFLDHDDGFGAVEGQRGVSGTILGGRSPDLYGPFWICSTVIFSLFFADTLAATMFSSRHGTTFEYRFDLLTATAGLMYGYTFIVPIVLWLIVRYLNISPGTSAIQLICLYGYSDIVWIPVAILSIVPLQFERSVFNIVRWIMIALGFAFSAAFVGKNVYNGIVPVHQSTSITVDKKPAGFLLGLILLVHAGLAVAVGFVFFR